MSYACKFYVFSCPYKIIIIIISLFYIGTISIMFNTTLHDLNIYTHITKVKIYLLYNLNKYFIKNKFDEKNKQIKIKINKNKLIIHGMLV